MSSVQQSIRGRVAFASKKTGTVLVIVLMIFSCFTSILLADSDPAPDLIITSLKVYGTPLEGNQIRVEVVIKNQKNHNITEDFGVALYLDNNTYSLEDYETISGGLKANKLRVVNLTWIATKGTHVLVVYADYTYSIPESNENNNRWDERIIVAERNTDLTVEGDLRLNKKDIRVGENVTVSATTCNLGQNTTKDINVTLFIDRAYTQSTVIHGLLKGERYNVSFLWKPVTFGNHTVNITIDPLNTITEQNETNNYKQRKVTVNGTRLPWWDTNWHYRKIYEVTGSGNLSLPMNFTQLLHVLQVKNKTFDNSSITIVRYYKNNFTIAGIVTEYEFNESILFDNHTRATGNLTWHVTGPFFYAVYFDVIENSGVRVGKIETKNMSMTGNARVTFTGSTEGWWSYFEPQPLLYYLPGHSFVFTVKTTALAASAYAMFYLNSTLNQTIPLMTADKITWGGSKTLSEQGHWKIEVFTNDTAGYHPPDNLTAEFYVGTPDLAVTSLDLPSSSIVYKNSTYIITAHICAYNTTVPNVNVSFFADSPSPAFDENVTIRNLYFNKDENKTVHFEWHPRTKGRYTLTVTVDPDNTITESTNNNNNRSRMLTVEGEPDLAVFNITIPTESINEGEPVEILANITNNGDGNATGYQVNLYFAQTGNVYTVKEKDSVLLNLSVHSFVWVPLVWNSSRYGELKYHGEWLVGVQALYDNETHPDSNPLNNAKISLNRVHINPGDLTAPNITVSVPSTHEQGLPITIIARSTDPSGIKSVNISIKNPNKILYENEQVLQENLNANTYEYAFTQTRIIGNYSFTITATDNSFQENERTIGGSFRITRDATAPSIPYVGAYPAVQLMGNEVTISCIVTDAMNVKTVQVTVQSPEGISETTTMVNASHDEKYVSRGTYDTIGKYVYSITAEDASGNKNTSESKVFWITTDLEDTDNDEMPDWWELQYGFDPYNASDAGLDYDKDGVTNLKEYESGTNPLKPLSTFSEFIQKLGEHGWYLLGSLVVCLLIVFLAVYGIRRRKT